MTTICCACGQPVYTKKERASMETNAHTSISEVILRRRNKRIAQLKVALRDILGQMEHVEEENEDWVRPWLEWQNIKAIAEKALGDNDGG